MSFPIIKVQFYFVPICIGGSGRQFARGSQCIDLLEKCLTFLFAQIRQQKVMLRDGGGIKFDHASFVEKIYLCSSLIFFSVKNRNPS